MMRWSSSSFIVLLKLIPSVSASLTFQISGSCESYFCACLRAFSSDKSWSDFTLHLFSLPELEDGMQGCCHMPYALQAVLL